MLNSILCLCRMILLILAGSEQVALENLALRQQLAVFQRTVRRPKIRPTDRLFWVCLLKIWKDWKSALVIVRPETVMDWHRKRFKRYWSRLSKHRNPGRPRIEADIRKLVKTMAEANLGWGAPRIHGELLKLGFEISERTVSRLMPKRIIAPSQPCANCLTHGRRYWVQAAANFPEECRYILEILGKVYHNDAIAREQAMTPDQRLKFHQTESTPLMDEMKRWLDKQVDEKLCEPNSDLGSALAYMLNHWKPLTLFLCVPGAPLEVASSSVPSRKRFCIAAILCSIKPSESRLEENRASRLGPRYGCDSRIGR